MKWRSWTQVKWQGDHKKPLIYENKPAICRQTISASSHQQRWFIVAEAHHDVHTPTHTNTDSHYGFCKDSKENICVLKVLPVIFLYFFPPAVIIFSPVKQIKTPRPNGGWGSSSDFPLSGSQTRCSYKQTLCWKTWPAVCVCWWICVNFLVSGNSTAHSGFNCTSFSNFENHSQANYNTQFCHFTLS